MSLIGRIARFLGFKEPGHAGMPKHFPGPYRIYTNKYDEEVHWRNIKRVTDPTFDGRKPSPDFLGYWANCLAYQQSARQLAEALATTSSASLAVTLLADQSGSLQGEKACRLAAAVGTMSECLSHLGVAHEVLGFTTRSWRGGQSAYDWREAGRPPFPGRLCDLLHIVYRAFADNGPMPVAALNQMTDADVLKENVDGEALQWACVRLRGQPASRRIIFMISDGAPVDDSTLLANGPNILDDHLRAVCADLIAEEDIELYGVGIEYAMYRYAPQYVVLRSTTDIGEILLPMMQAILTSPNHAPHRHQLG